VKIGLLYSSKLKNYDFGPGHPFRGDRFESFLSYFNITLLKSNKFEVFLNEESASDEELEFWHTREYIQAMQKASMGTRVSNLMRYISMDNVNPTTRQFPQGIEPAARVICKDAMLACEFVQEGKYEKAISIGGGLHHARPSYGEGFCVYNDVVICAKHAIRKYGLKKVLILDTDAHAGNGTSQAFYSDSRVLLIDIHQRGIYPGTGYEDDIGAGEGEGYTVNVPLPPFASDEAYRFVFEELIFPLVERFEPELVIRNGGSDPHFSDEITQLGLTLEGFRYIGRSVREIAETCDGKEVDLICSGYNPQVMCKAWSALISGLADVPVDLEEEFLLVSEKTRIVEGLEDIVKKVKGNVEPYWGSL
jgi:acetoin utilization protein AcuC